MDPIDKAREDNRRADRSRENRPKDRAALERAGSNFQSKIQKQIQRRDLRDSREAASSGDKKEEGDLLSRVIQVFRKKEGEKEKQEGFLKDVIKQEIGKKEGGRDSKRDVKESKEKSKPPEIKIHGRSEEGHQRVDGLPTFSRDGEKQGGRDSDSSDKDSSGSHQGSRSFVAKIKSSDSTGERSFSQGRAFSQKDLDEVVTAVRLGVNEAGDKELEIHLSDAYFHGLKFKATKVGDHIVLTFICPNNVVKGTFLIHRPKIYSTLKERGINIGRIDIQ